jgi:hypothetical protein
MQRRTRRRRASPIVLCAVPYAVVLVAVALASTGTWPCDGGRGSRPAAGGSLTALVLGDRLTLGSVRLSVVVLALFAVGSVTALALAGRWLHAFGNGIQAEPLRESYVELRTHLAARGQEITALRRQRDAYRDRWLSCTRELAARPAPESDQAHDTRSAER